MKKQVKNLLIAVLQEFSMIESANGVIEYGGHIGFYHEGVAAGSLAEIRGLLAELSNEDKEIDEIPESIRQYVTSFGNWDEIINLEAGVNGLSEYEDEVIALFE